MATLSVASLTKTSPFLIRKEGVNLVYKDHKPTSPFNVLDCQESNFEAKEGNPKKLIHGIYSGSSVESPIKSGNYKA